MVGCIVVTGMVTAGDRDGALFYSRHLAWPGRRRLENGEGEFPLNEASATPVKAARAIGGAVARYFMVVGSALAILLLIAGWSLPEPPASFPDRPDHRKGGHPDQIRADMA